MELFEGDFRYGFERGWPKKWPPKGLDRSSSTHDAGKLSGGTDILSGMLESGV